MKYTGRFIWVFLTIVTLVFLCIFLWWHVRLGATRYVDVDEFAHLHWAANMVRGQIPYKDFLIFFPPGFHVLLAPFLQVGWGTADPIFWTRMLAFGIFVGLVGALVGLFWQMRRSLPAALLAGALLAFLPLPFDKFLEVRPDPLAMLVALIAMILQIQWMRTGKKHLAFWSGFVYAIALLVLTKMAPHVGVAALFIVLWAVRARDWTGMRMFFSGIAIPFLLFLAWVLVFVNVDTVVYSLFLLPIEANRLGLATYMGPDLFFHPNWVYYGVWGWSKGLVTNHVVWIVGILIGAYRLVGPWLATKESSRATQKSAGWVELLVASIFFADIASFMYGFPLRHTQYLIPIAVFVSFYAADGVYLFWQTARSRWVRGVYIGLYVLLLTFLYYIFVGVNEPKLAWTNAKDVRALEHSIATIPKDAFVFDLVGTTLYFRDPYPVCCMPFGQWARYLSRPLPSLTDALVRTRTQYIYEGGRLNTLSPADFAFIQSHFGEPVDGLRQAY